MGGASFILKFVETIEADSGHSGPGIAHWPRGRTHAPRYVRADQPTAAGVVELDDASKVDDAYSAAQRYVQQHEVAPVAPAVLF